MLGAGYTFLADGHVRVDIFYARREADRTRDLIDLAGAAVFVIPSMLAPDCGGPGPSSPPVLAHP